MALHDDGTLIVLWTDDLKCAINLSEICHLWLWYRFKVFLTLFGETGLNDGHGWRRGKRKSAGHQAAHMKEKHREAGCKLDSGSVYRVWLLETQHLAYLPYLPYGSQNMWIYSGSAASQHSTVWMCQCEFEVIVFVIYWITICFAAELVSHSNIKLLQT